jgi:CRP/FNR family cyclic AMP-dependent transcriptional regulator
MSAAASRLLWDHRRAVETLEAWKRLVPLEGPRRLDAGIDIFRQGQTAHKIFLLAKGLVVLTSDLPTGDESVLGLRFAGQILDLCTSAMKCPYAFSARTMSPCVVYGIDAPSLHERERRDPEVTRMVLDLLRYDLYSAAAFIVDLKTLPPDERLHRFLHFAILAMGLKPIEGTFQIPMPLRDEQVASLVGVSTRQFKRIKKKMYEAGRISMCRSSDVAASRLVTLPFLP